MENIIKKSIVGGWQPKYEQTTINSSVINFCEDGSILTTDEVGRKLEIYDKEKIVLDPLFWQALGKACGWGGNVNFVCTIDCDYYCNDCKLGFTHQTERPKEFSGINGTHIDCPKALYWKQIALSFHEINLTEGWDSAISYLNNLVK
jgi:hypothetical protein